jgi:hypothetical protein
MTVQKIPLQTVALLSHVTQQLPSDGCFSGSTVFTLSKYATNIRFNPEDGGNMRFRDISDITHIHTMQRLKCRINA